MKKLTLFGAAVAGAVVLALCAVSLQAAAPTPAPQPSPAEVVYQTTPAHSVIYTVHNGTPKSAITAANELMRLRDESGMHAADDTGAFVYLEQPSDDNAARLIEIQFPVEEESAKAWRQDLQRLASASGLGTTGVRSVPQRTDALITKPAGVVDPSAYWKTLYTVVRNNGQTTVQAPTEVFSDVSAIPLSCAYAELETTLTVSVQ